MTHSLPKWKLDCSSYHHHDLFLRGWGLGWFSLVYTDPGNWSGRTIIGMCWPFYITCRKGGGVLKSTLVDRMDQDWLNSVKKKSGRKKTCSKVITYTIFVRVTRLFLLGKHGQKHKAFKVDFSIFFLYFLFNKFYLANSNSVERKKHVWFFFMFYFPLRIYLLLCTQI